MKSFSRSMQCPSTSITSWGLIVAGLLVFTGCGRDQVKTYRVPKDAVSASAANPHGDMAGGSPHGDMTGGMGAHGQAATLPRVEYTVPAGWEEMPMGGMRAAHFGITKGELKADVSVVPLPGATAAGGAIVNMWREQLHLKPADESELGKAEKVAVGPAEGQLYEIASTEMDASKHKMAVLAALVKQEQTTWVFKMLGESGLVHEQQPAFLSFLKSIKFTEGQPADPHAGMAMGNSPMAMPGMAAPAEGATAKPTWTVPADWKEQPATRMLLAKFVAGSDAAQTEITVSSFPGDVGGLLANVNRWRGQIGLPAIAEADLSKETSAIDVTGGKATLVDITGANPRSGQKARMVGAIVPRGGQTWFYKMLGDEQLTAQQKDAFIKFVQSVRYPNAG